MGENFAHVFFLNARINPLKPGVTSNLLWNIKVVQTILPSVLASQENADGGYNFRMILYTKREFKAVIGEPVSLPTNSIRERTRN
jgi:hypothetical protein